MKLTGAYVCLLVCMMMTPIEVLAEEVTTQAEPRMTYISIYSTELQISNTGQATITGSVRGKTGTTSTYVKVILQEYVSGTWEDVEDWEVTKDARNASVNETYQVTSGTYRVYMICRANTETMTAVSAERTY